MSLFADTGAPEGTARLTAPAICCRENADRVAVANSLWVMDCLVEGRLLPTGEHVLFVSLPFAGGNPLLVGQPLSLGYTHLPLRCLRLAGLPDTHVFLRAPHAAEYDRPGNLMDTLKGLAEQEAAEAEPAGGIGGGGEDSVECEVPDSEEEAQAHAVGAAHQAALAAPAEAAAAEAAALPDAGAAGEEMAAPGLRASGSAPQVISETVLTAPGWQPKGGSVEQMPPVAEEDEVAAEDGAAEQPVAAHEPAGEAAGLPQLDGASDEEMEEPETEGGAGGQQAAAAASAPQRSNSSGDPRLPDPRRLGVRTLFYLRGRLGHLESTAS